MHLIKLNSASGESSAEICLLLFLYQLFGKQNIFFTLENIRSPPQKEIQDPNAFLRLLNTDEQIVSNNHVFECHPQNLDKLSRGESQRPFRFNGEL